MYIILSGKNTSECDIKLYERKIRKNINQLNFFHLMNLYRKNIGMKIESINDEQL